jgi:hypothetical protein
MSGAITAASIEEARAEIGVERVVLPWNTVASPDAIRHFLLGVGDDDPRWWSGDESELPPVAPDGFLYSCVDGPIVPGAIDQPGADTWFAGASGMWASDRWKWHAPVPTGTRLRVTTALWSVEERERRGAPLAVRQTTRTTFVDGRDGDEYAELFRTILRFDPPAGTNPLDVPLEAYDDDELELFRTQHRAEKVAGSSDRAATSIRVGDVLPVLLKGPLTITNVIGWLLGVGSPLNQTNRVLTKLLDVNPGAARVNPTTRVADTIEATHWEPDLARLVGLPRGYDFGGQRIGWAIHLLSDWRAGRGRLAEIEAKLLRPNLLGDVQWLEGEVVSIEGTDVTCEVRARNQRDEVTLAARALIVGVAPSDIAE